MHTYTHNTYTHTHIHTRTLMHTQHMHTCTHVHTTYTCNTHTGIFAIRAEREFVISKDFMKAVRKVSDNKKLEAKMDYKSI